jgi:hypothetical protein
MKTRLGFVSNSSSSSFVVAYDPTTNTKKEYNDTIVELVCSKIFSADNLPSDKDEAYSACVSDDSIIQYMIDHPNLKFAFWSGSNLDQGRDEIIQEMYQDSKLIHYYESSSNTNECYI